MHGAASTPIIPSPPANRGSALEPWSMLDNTSPASASPSPVQPSVLVRHRVFVDEKKLLLTSIASPSANSNYRTVTTCQSSRPVEVERLQVGQLLPRRGRLTGSHNMHDDISSRDDGTSMCETELERTKRKTARARERRATLVLGVVMISFVGCWLPFFFIYPVSLLTGLYSSLDSIDSMVYCNFRFPYLSGKYRHALLTGLQVPESVFAVIFWLGYCNSALNPIIYTVFNRDFRRAFQKLLSRSSADCKNRRM